MRASMDIGDLVKDKRVIIGGVVVLLLLIGGVVAWQFGGTNSGANQASLPQPGSLPPSSLGAPGMASGSPGVAGAPGMIGASGAPIVVSSPGGMPGTVGVPGTTSGMPGSRGATLAAAIPAPNSFAGAPAGFGTGQTGVGGLGAPGMSGGGPGMSSMSGMPGGMGGMGMGGAAGGAATGPKPAPIVQGARPVAARMDPFIPFYKLIVEQSPAYSLIVPIRVASRPTPPPQKVDDIAPDIRFGPLPPVQRRVAGVLFDGSVSAIMETGTPGSSSTDVRVIQPGATVPSGVPNIPDLTVASISPSAVLLRAQDGRTVTVKLSNVSAEFADSFHSAANGPGVGGPSTGGPGGPGGPGGDPRGKL